MMDTRFEVCSQCRNHGHFVFLIGTRSSDLLCQSDAYEAMMGYYRADKIPSGDINLLVEQIRQSGLPLFLSQEILDVMQREGSTETMMLNNPIVWPTDWDPEGHEVAHTAADIVCSLCQELIDGRPMLQ
ncbi:MAG: hypothetical protein KBD19_01255 [Candidatus Moranbacteria bacterium]|nr:hypothetical protein [Candidatus Moranbacteria bacterium]